MMTGNVNELKSKNSNHLSYYPHYTDQIKKKNLNNGGHPRRDNTNRYLLEYKGNITKTKNIIH